MKSKITEFQFSVDGKNWHGNSQPEDKFFRERIVEKTDWSEPFELKIGQEND